MEEKVRKQKILARIEGDKIARREREGRRRGMLSAIPKYIPEGKAARR